MKKQVQFTVVKYQDKDGVWIGRVLELEGCHTYGATLEELNDNLKEVVELCLEDGEIAEKSLSVEKQEFLVDV